VGILDRLVGRDVVDIALDSVVPSPVRGPRQTFAVGDDLTTWNALVSGTGCARISRAEALSVPAVKRARDLIAGSLAILPLFAVNSLGQRIDVGLLQQPESALGLVRAVTVAMTVEDLMLEGRCLWLILLRTSQGFPQAVQRIEFGKWSQDATTGEIRVDGRVVDNRDLILFTSPNSPLLVTGARAIRNLLELERTAARYADEPEASVSWRATDGVDPDEDDVRGFLSAWVAARKARATAFVPAAFEQVESKRLTPEESQLISAREFMVTEVARLTGIDADALSVNTTTRTYSNITQRRREFVDFVLGPLLVAIEQRLSLGDVTPRGTEVRFNLDAFLRADTGERYSSYAVAIDKGFLSVDEVRELEHREPLEAPA
jgi:hypothetical protein